MSSKSATAPKFIAALKSPGLPASWVQREMFFESAAGSKSILVPKYEQSVPGGLKRNHNTSHHGNRDEILREHILRVELAVD